MKKIAKLIGLLVLVPAVILMTAWGTLAIYWSNPPPGLLRTVSAAIFGLTASGEVFQHPVKKHHGVNDEQQAEQSHDPAIGAAFKKRARAVYDPGQQRF